MSHFTERVCCPSCGLKNTSVVYQIPYDHEFLTRYLKDFYSQTGGVEFEYLYNEEFVLEKCNECGLVYQKFIPDDFLMNKLYNEWIDPQKVRECHLRAGSHDLNYHLNYTLEINDLINHFGKLPQELTFLDFGMGWGKWCIAAKSLGCKVYGCEISDERIENARLQGIDVIDYDQISEHEFDFVNTEQVFEHIPEPGATLNHLLKGLKDEGLIRISVPNGVNILDKLSNPNWGAGKFDKDSLNEVAPLEHINCFSFYSICRMAANENLEQVILNRKAMLINNDASFSNSLGGVTLIMKHFLKGWIRRTFQRGLIYDPGTNLLFKKVEKDSNN